MKTYLTNDTSLIFIIESVNISPKHLKILLAIRYIQKLVAYTAINITHHFSCFNSVSVLWNAINLQ